MSSTVFLAPTANYIQKALNGSIDSSVQTITLNNTTNLQSPGAVVIDRVNSSGVATPDSREVVSYTGISGSDLTGCTRGADGSTARSHNDTAIVEAVPTIGMWNNLATIVSSGLDSSGYLKAIASPVSIAIMHVPTHLNASGASISGSFLSSKIISSTRDMTAITGTVAYTGVGFKPTAIIALFQIDSTTIGGVGFSDSALGGGHFLQLSGGNTQNGTQFMLIDGTGGASQSATINSYDSDGFTLSWTKTGSPSAGTANLRFLCFR